MPSSYTTRRVSSFRIIRNPPRVARVVGERQEGEPVSVVEVALAGPDDEEDHAAATRTRLTNRVRIRTSMRASVR